MPQRQPQRHRRRRALLRRPTTVASWPTRPRPTPTATGTATSATSVPAILSTTWTEMGSAAVRTTAAPWPTRSRPTPTATGRGTPATTARGTFQPDAGRLRRRRAGQRLRQLSGDPELQPGRCRLRRRRRCLRRLPGRREQRHGPRRPLLRRARQLLLRLQPHPDGLGRGRSGGRLRQLFGPGEYEPGGQRSRRTRKSVRQLPDDRQSDPDRRGHGWNRRRL